MFHPAPQVDLTTEEHIRQFFSDTPFACRKAIELSGGHVNYTFRLYLVTPYRGHSTLILKHAKLHMKYCSSVLLDTDRQLYEYEALQRMKAWLLRDSIVTVPTVYLFDPKNQVLVLEDAGDWTLKRFMAERDLSATLAKDIGSALGHFLAGLHGWGRGNGELISAFKDNGKIKEIFTKKFYGNMRSILMGIDAIGKYHGPALGIKEDELRLIGQAEREVSESRLTVQDSFIMGDFAPGNMMIKVTPDNKLERIYVFDWESVGPWENAIDVGHFSADMHTLQTTNERCQRTAQILLETFLGTYKKIAHPRPDFARKVMIEIGTHMITIIPHQLVSRETELTQTVVKEGMNLIIKAYSEDSSWLRSSPVRYLISRD